MLTTMENFVWPAGEVKFVHDSGGLEITKIKQAIVNYWKIVH